MKVEHGHRVESEAGVGDRMDELHSDESAVVVAVSTLNR